MRALAPAVFLAFALSAGPAHAVCVTGTAIGCDDQDPCTDDLCELFSCTHTPASGPACDDGNACTTGDHCEQGRCSGGPVACAGDGFSCTDEVCTTGGCIHVPVDERCAPAAGCASAACAPLTAGADAAGCVSEGCTREPDPPSPLPCALPGTPLGCDDRNPCTADRCELAGCMHTLLGGTPCNDRDGCTTGDHCEAGSCVGVPVTCAEDGFSCTDDVCLAGGCVHVPVDSRCVPAGQCTSAACTPERPERDAAGCVVGPARADGEACAEDGSACTRDACDRGECVQSTVLDPPSCALVQDVFRQALVLEAQARGLLVTLGAALPEALAARLGHIATELAATAASLAGKGGVDDAPPTTPFQETALRRRARAALVSAQQARRQAATLLVTVRLGGVRAELGGSLADEVERQARALLRGTRELRAEIRRLRRVTSSLAR